MGLEKTPLTDEERAELRAEIDQRGATTIGAHNVRRLLDAADEAARLRTELELLKSGEPMCAECRAPAVTKHVEHRFRYGDSVELTATVPCRKCRKCGEEWLDHEAEEAMADAIVRHLGKEMDEARRRLPRWLTDPVRESIDGWLATPPKDRAFLCIGLDIAAKEAARRTRRTHRALVTMLACLEAALAPEHRPSAREEER